MRKGKISGETRVKIIMEVFSGRPITEVAEDYGVHRTTVYRWLKKARAAIENELSTDQEQDSVDRKGRSRQSSVLEVSRLNNELKKKQQENRYLKKKIRVSSQPDPRPAACPECGCEKLYKNGAYYTSLEHLIPSSFREKADIPVQRFVCPSCNHSTYLDFPRILWHWLHDDQ